MIDEQVKVIPYQRQQTEQSEKGSLVEKNTQEVSSILSEKQASQLLNFSFFLSKGDPDMQELFFHYFHKRFSDMQVGSDVSDEVLAHASVEKVLHLIASGKHSANIPDSGPITGPVAKVDGKAMAERMRQIFNGSYDISNTNSSEVILLDIVERMMRKDIQEYKNSETSREKKRQYISYISYLTGERKAAGIPPFNTLLTEASQLLRSRFDNANRQELYDAIGVAQGYYNRYTGKKADLLHNKKVQESAH